MFDCLEVLIGATDEEMMKSNFYIDVFISNNVYLIDEGQINVYPSHLMFESHVLDLGSV